MGALGYSLGRSRGGWAWRVRDSRGLVVAGGSASSQAEALQALDQTLRALAQVDLSGARGA